MRTLTLLSPWNLFESRFFIILAILSVVKIILAKDVFVRYKILLFCFEGSIRIFIWVCTSLILCRSKKFDLLLINFLRSLLFSFTAFLILLLIHGGSVVTNYSWGIKLLFIFKMVPLKIETYLLGFSLPNALLQPKLSTARLMRSILARL